MPASISRIGLVAARTRFDEYSARKIAVSKPIGTATSIEIPVISSVPVNSGTAPKLPDEPTWSARIAVCGLQLSPNRNSVRGTSRKKRIASKSTDMTMPIVVNIAMLEAPISKPLTTRSTLLRARKSGVILRHAIVPPSMARPRASTTSRFRLAETRSR